MYETIPPAIRDLLAKRWQPTQEGFSFFEGPWGEERNRRARPSWYVYSKEPEGRTINMLTTEEAAALAAVPEFEHVAVERPNNYAVNEHLEHALSDFLSKVYDAWDEFAERAKAIDQAQLPPQD